MSEISKIYKPRYISNMRVELYSHDEEYDEFRLDISIGSNEVILDKQQTKQLYEHLRECLKNTNGNTKS